MLSDRTLHCKVTISPFEITVFRGSYFETTQISYFCLNFHPLILASIGASCLQLLLLWGCNGVPHSFNIYQLEFFCRKMLYPLPVYLFSYSSISIWTCRYFLCPVSYDSILSRFILLLKSWPLGALLGWLQCLFNIFHPLFK